jgi:hypothetical protein
MSNLSIPRVDVEDLCVHGLVKLYVATAFSNAAEARAVHALVEPLGITPASLWAADANGPEDLRDLPRAKVRAIAHHNDRDLLSAHLVLVLAKEGAGGEMFVEVRLALAHRIPVLWVGERRILSAYREGVLCVDRLGDAMIHLRGFLTLIGHMTAFEKHRAREVLWGLIECLQDEDTLAVVAKGSHAA